MCHFPMGLTHCYKTTVFFTFIISYCDFRFTTEYNIKLCSVVFSVTGLLVINSYVDRFREQQTTPLTSDECHQLATCMSNLAVGPLTTRDEARYRSRIVFFPTPPAFKVPVRVLSVGILPICHNVRYRKLE